MSGAASRGGCSVSALPRSRPRSRPCSCPAASSVRRPPEPEEIRHQALEGVTLDHPWKAGQAAQGEVLDDWLASFRRQHARFAGARSADRESGFARRGVAHAPGRRLLVQARAPLFPAWASPAPAASRIRRRRRSELGPAGRGRSRVLGARPVGPGTLRA